jgi:hypothetical protein
MEKTRIQIRAPRGNSDPGKVLEQHYKVIGDTVMLVDPSGKPLMSDDQKYSRTLSPGDNPKQVAAQLLRQHYNASRSGPRDFNRPPELSTTEILSLRGTQGPRLRRHAASVMRSQWRSTGVRRRFRRVPTDSATGVFAHSLRRGIGEVAAGTPTVGPSSFSAYKACPSR